MACGSRSATSYTLACLRCTTPNPSETKASASWASWSAKAPRWSSSLLVSPGLKRTFSRTATSPSSRASTVSWADGPTVSSANATSRPNSSPRRSATGRRVYRSSGSPFGRPRWATTTTRAPASASSLMVGTLARTRPSSVIRVPSSGTFRSERTRTRLPRTSPKESMPAMVGRPSEGGADEGRQVDEAVGGNPPLVGPPHDLDLVAVRQRETGVERARGWPGDDVRADDLVLGVLEVLRERAGVCGGLERGIHLVLGDLAAQGGGEIGDRAGGHRHPQRVPVHLALELREHQRDRLGCTGGRRDDAGRSGTGAPQVDLALAVQRDLVEELLLGRVRVHRGHEAPLDAEVVEEDLRHRAEAVGGAARVGDDVVRRRVVDPVVDAHHDRDVLIGRRCRDDHLLGAAVDVLAGVGRLGEQTRGLDHDVGAHVA